MPLPRPSHWELTTSLRPADVAVVGAGLTGLHAARLLKAGNPSLDVVLLDAHAVPRGAATRNAGFACFGSPTELLADLDEYGYAATVDTVRGRFRGIEHLRKHYAPRNVGWAEHGGYEVIDDPAVEAGVRARLPELNALLAEATAGKASWRFTGPTPGGPSGALLYNPLEAQLHPGLLVERLLEDCRRVGVRTLFGALVENFGPSPGGGSILHGKWGSLTAQRVLLTVNAFLDRLAPELAAPLVKPVRNQVLLSRPLPGPRLRGCYHYHQGYVYFRNVGPDRLLIGGGRHVAGKSSETSDFGPGGAAEDYLLQKLRAWWPGRDWRAEDFPTRWSGILAQGNGKTPLLEPIGEGVLYAGRLCGMGVALSAELAERAAAKVLKT